MTVPIPDPNPTPSTASDSADPEVRTVRRTGRARAVVVAFAAASTLGGCGCEIDSTLNPPKGMTCVQAHDAPNGGNPYPVCDVYSPVPTGGAR